MEQELVHLVIGRLAVIAGHDYVDVVGHQRSLKLGKPLDDLLGDDDGIGARALGERDRDGGGALKRAVRRLGEVPRLALERLGADDDVGDVAHVDGAPVASGEQQQPHVGELRNTLMTSAVVSVLFASVLFAIGRWGRRNAAGLVPTALSEAGQRSQELVLRRGSVACQLVGGIFLIFGLVELVTWVIRL